MTLFPQVFEPFFSLSLMAKAAARGVLRHRLIDIRDYARDRHKSCDDAPFGGGAGMVMKPEPIAAAFTAAGSHNYRSIYLSPSGRLFNQDMAGELAAEQKLLFLCGRYEGVDQRIIDRYIDDELSVGDYVLSGGETAAMVVIEAVSRLRNGFLNRESLVEESFSAGLLEYPHYTRPENFADMPVPEILRGGNHRMIYLWRLFKSWQKTNKIRPDLLAGYEKSKDMIEAIAMFADKEKKI